MNARDARLKESRQVHALMGAWGREARRRAAEVRARRYHRRALWRIGVWGVLGAGALFAASSVGIAAVMLTVAGGVITLYVADAIIEERAWR